MNRSAVGPGERTLPAAEAKLRQTALQMEGMFVQRMFAAMRDTVPQDGLMGQSSAEQTFGSLLDEKLAEQVPTQWTGEHSLAEALYRQLRKRIETPAGAESAAAPADTTNDAPSTRSTVTPESR